MATEQSKDNTWMEIKDGIKNDKVPNSLKQKRIIIDDILYYMSNVDLSQF